MECAKIVNFIDGMDGMDGMGVSSPFPNKNGYHYSIAVQLNWICSHTPNTINTSCNCHGHLVSNATCFYFAPSVPPFVFLLIICATLPGVSQGS